MAVDIGFTDPTTGTSAPDRQQRLRLVLRLNAGSSAVSAAALLFFPGTVDELLDTGRPGWIRLVGLGLLPFAAYVAWLSGTDDRRIRRDTPTIVVADLAWVVASVGAILLGWFPPEGAIAVGAVATVVALWATLQWRQWTRLRV